jgi:hypothetical protein
MGKQKKKNEDYTPQHHTNAWYYCIQIGFFAGLIWGTVRWMLFEMSFTKELPGFALLPFTSADFLSSFWGTVLGIGSFILFSIVAALLYKAALGKWRGPMGGIVYGLMWWGIIFAGIGPWLGLSRWLTQAGWSTISTEICVFLLWGVFIGYSIAFEFTDEASREPIKAR